MGWYKNFSDMDIMVCFSSLCNSLEDEHPPLKGHDGKAWPYLLINGGHTYLQWAAFIEASHSCSIAWATSQNGKWLVMIANPSGKNEKVTNIRRWKLFGWHNVHQGRSALFICEWDWLKGNVYICSFHRRNEFYKRPQCQRCTGLFK